VSSRRDRVLLDSLEQLKLQVARLETIVDIIRRTPPATPPAATSSGSALPTAGGIIGLVAGAITTWSQLTGKA
jgi:hypothetical protein